MRTSIHALAIALSVVFAAAPAHADEPAKKPAAAAPAKGKEVTLKGTMMCAKCALQEGDECRNVLKVKKVKYYLAKNEVAEKNHDNVCSGEAKATVTGTVGTEKGKKVLTASEIKYE